VTDRTDAEEVADLMRRAGWALFRFRGAGTNIGMQVMRWECVGDPHTEYGYTPVEVRPGPPTTGEIFLMDEASRWLSFIDDNVRRRIVAMRMLWNDWSGRNIYSYRKIGREVGTSATIVRIEYYRGLAEIAQTLNKNYSFLDRIELYRRVDLGAS